MSNGVLANSIAGLVAGGISTIAMHPLDLVKTRMQVAGGKTTTLLRLIYKEHGVAGLYRGIGTNLFGGTLAWGFYFGWYGQIKNWIGGDRVHLSGGEYLFSAAAAGLLTSICTNPIWVVKTRMLTTTRGERLAYTSFLDGLQSIMKQEGVKGLYRGLTPSLFGVSHGALQFTIYEKLKDYSYQRNPGEKITTAEYLLLSAISKLCASSLTYPYQVFRSRLQVHNVDASVSVSSVFNKIMRTDGVRGFYRGLTPNLLRVVPTTCITMVVYEKMNQLLSGS